LDALRKKDYKSAYSFLSDHIKREVWFENFEEYLYHRYLDEISDHKFGGDFNVAVNGSNGEYKTTIILENDSTLPLTLNLMKFG